MEPTRGFSGLLRTSLNPSAPNLGPRKSLSIDFGKKTSSKRTPFKASNPNRFPEITLRTWGIPPISKLKSSFGYAIVAISPSTAVTLPLYNSKISSFSVDIPVQVPVDCSAAIAAAALLISRFVAILYLHIT